MTDTRDAAAPVPDGPVPLILALAMLGSADLSALLFAQALDEAAPSLAPAPLPSPAAQGFAP